MKEVKPSMTDAKLSVLTEQYKLITEEGRIYLREIFKCFTYAAFLIAIYLGLESEILGKGISNLRRYMPIAIVGLSIYYLTLSYSVVIIQRYKGEIEKKINRVISEDLLDYEFDYKRRVIMSGFITIDNRKKFGFPTPNIILGVAFFILILLVFLGVEIKGKNVEVGLLIFCGFMTVYTFLIAPNVIDKKVLHNNKAEE